MNQALPFLAVASIALVVPARALAQLPLCTGNDAEGATAAFEEGNRLMTEAIEQAGRRRIDRARELAAEALAQFDAQCALGDASALAERGAALMLMGEALRSAQSYDAYLVAHPLDSLDARTRRRIEANLQPGSVTLELDGDVTRGMGLFIDDLDFGDLPRDQPVRLPLGDHALEVRTRSGEVLVSAVVSLIEGSTDAHLLLALPGAEPAALPDPGPEPEPDPEPTPVEEPAGTRTDFLPYLIATGVGAGVFLGLAIALQVAADGRAQTWNEFCRDRTIMYAGCPAVRDEYDGLFGGAIASYVLAGLAAAGLGTALALELSQPRERLRITLAPGPDGVSAGVGGSF